MALNRSVRVGLIIAGEQPTAADLGDLRDQGIRSVVNLRLASETAVGLTPSQEGRLATELGLAYAHLPVSAEHLSDEDARDFRDVLARLPAPVYVHCGLGQRATALAVVADGERSVPVAHVLADAERHGISISPKVQDFIQGNLERQQDERQQDEALFARVVR